MPQQLYRRRRAMMFITLLLLSLAPAVAAAAAARASATAPTRWAFVATPHTRPRQLQAASSLKASRRRLRPIGTASTTVDGVGPSSSSSSSSSPSSFFAVSSTAAAIAVEEGEESSVGSVAATTRRAGPRLIKYAPLLDFAQPTTIDVIDRLDDAIMGGISTSTVVHSNGSSSTNDSSAASAFASWVGVCREEGGGFCGWRTNPFKTSLQVSEFDGLYLVARLSSDDDVNRRVWKISTRSRPDRGEQLYQAPIGWPSMEQRGQQEDDGATDKKWTTIQVPFDSFRLVRGPQVVPNAPPLNITGGLYQIGMTMGKFVFAGDASNGTRSTLSDFRPGFFQLDLKEIGAYRYKVKEEVEDAASPPDAAAAVVPLSPNQVLTKDEAKKQRPVWFRYLLLPLLKLAFGSEPRQRRQSALRILKKTYNMSARQAIGFAFRQRANSIGWFRSATKTVRIVLEEVARFVLGLPLRLAIVYPLRVASWLSRRRLSSATQRDEVEPELPYKPDTTSTSP